MKKWDVPNVNPCTNFDVKSGLEELEKSSFCNRTR